MRAARYRLRFVTGVAEAGATYGGGDYGDATYGQRASDPVEHNIYVPIPLPAGYPTTPSWIYRRGDTLPPFRAQIRARELGALGLIGVSSARLILTPLREDCVLHSYVLTMEDRTAGIVRRDWEPGDLLDRGIYTPTIRLNYTSGRRFTVPYDSRLLFVIGGQDVIL